MAPCQPSPPKRCGRLGRVSTRRGGNVDYLHDSHLHHLHHATRQPAYGDEHRIGTSNVHPVCCVCTAEQCSTAGRRHGPWCTHKAVLHGDQSEHRCDGVLLNPCKHHFDELR